MKALHSPFFLWRFRTWKNVAILWVSESLNFKWIQTQVLKTSNWHIIVLRREDSKILVTTGASLSLLVNMVSIWKWYISLFSSYHVHKNSRKCDLWRWSQCRWDSNLTRFLVNTPMVSIWSSYVASFSSYRVHKRRCPWHPQPRTLPRWWQWPISLTYCPSTLPQHETTSGFPIIAIIPRFIKIQRSWLENLQRACPGLQLLTFQNL